jgi:Family of unknown function (DUF5808)
MTNCVPGRRSVVVGGEVTAGLVDVPVVQRLRAECGQALRDAGTGPGMVIAPWRSERELALDRVYCATPGTAATSRASRRAWTPAGTPLVPPSTTRPPVPGTAIRPAGGRTGHQPCKTRCMARGRFLGLPYDWRRPSWARIRHEIWNPQSRRILVPKAFGWGYGINFAGLIRFVLRG